MSLFLKFNNAVAIGIVRYTAITNMLNHGFMKLMLNSAEISLVKRFFINKIISLLYCLLARFVIVSDKSTTMKKRIVSENTLINLVKTNVLPSILGDARSELPSTLRSGGFLLHRPDLLLGLYPQ